MQTTAKLYGVVQRHDHESPQMMEEIILPSKVFAAGEEPTGERGNHHDNALD
ncbi:unnamed protein product [Brassica napus]|uniref:(rape) hypothetical protein n=1 Tax=Brassica napus TaxID=3708 RepID=A0A817AAZ4_BRANA|nr:unnamed protein product [Brassica napus]